MRGPQFYVQIKSLEIIGYSRFEADPSLFGRIRP